MDLKIIRYIKNDINKLKTNNEQIKLSLFISGSTSVSGFPMYLNIFFTFKYIFLILYKKYFP